MAKNFIYALTSMCITSCNRWSGLRAYGGSTSLECCASGFPAYVQGEYGINQALFWMVLHPVNLVLFIITLVLHWRTPAKNSTLLPFITYLAILVITQIYFVPELISITTTPFSETVDPLLTSRATLWEVLAW